MAGAEHAARRRLRSELALGCLSLFVAAGGARADAPAAYAALGRLAGEWQADLPGYGAISNTIRTVSNGRAIEETIGTPADNETSLYTLAGARLELTHYCAMTSDGHQVRLRATPPAAAGGPLVFRLVEATNLHSSFAPHMREVVLNVVDQDHFSERWTKREGTKDTVFELNFVRRATR